MKVNYKSKICICSYVLILLELLQIFAYIYMSIISQNWILYIMTILIMLLGIQKIKNKIKSIKSINK